MNTITTTRRRSVQPGRLTTFVESKLTDAVGVLIAITLEAEEGTALSQEALELANGLQAFVEAYKG